MLFIFQTTLWGGNSHARFKQGVRADMTTLVTSLQSHHNREAPAGGFGGDTKKEPGGEGGGRESAGFLSTPVLYYKTD